MHELVSTLGKWIELYVQPGRSTRRTMQRLFSLILMAVVLAFASGPALAVPAADCPMAGEQMPVDQADMDCCAPACAPECAVACSAGVMPQLGRASNLQHHSADLPTWLPRALLSTDPVGADPPPRTTFS